MKPLAVLLLSVITFCSNIHASNNVYELRFTITNTDGSKSDGNAIFRSDDSACVPIKLNIEGLCVLKCVPIIEEKTTKIEAGIFEILMSAGTAGPEMKTIFYSLLPVSIGKEMRLYRFASSRTNREKPGSGRR